MTVSQWRSLSRFWSSLGFFLCCAEGEGLLSLSGTVMFVVGVGLLRPLRTEEALFTVFVTVKLNVIIDALVCTFRRDLWEKTERGGCGGGSGWWSLFKSKWWYWLTYGLKLELYSTAAKQISSSDHLRYIALGFLLFFLSKLIRFFF